jgi:gluconate 2-dehydrogenase gamma chain
MVPTMKTISRRTALRLLAAAPAAAAMTWTPAEAQQAHQHAEAARMPAKTAFKPKFFTAYEYAMVTVLVDLIIPRDERSGSATDAGVPQFMDFMMIDQPQRQVAMRGGLALIDRLTDSRVGKRFVAANDAQRRQVLDEIAYTTNPDPGLSQAITFFSSFRDLTAGGFWSTKMGVKDLQYVGNTFVSEWEGCPDAALKKLGVAYKSSSFLLAPDAQLPSERDNLADMIGSVVGDEQQLAQVGLARAMRDRGDEIDLRVRRQPLERLAILADRRD